MSVPYVHSNYERIADDNYQTIDTRCVHGLVESIGISGDIVDCCSPSGSGIVKELNNLLYSARCIGDAFSDFRCDWIASNPPYKKGVVDNIIKRQIERIEKNDVVGVAMLLRTNFDHAKSRNVLFEHPLYWGQIKLRFRPYWTEERTASPIHNYVWHVWTAVPKGEKIVRYW